MTDDGKIIDLGAMFGQDNPGVPQGVQDIDSQNHKVDMSGKPVPKGITGLLDNGLEIKLGTYYCDTTHDGKRVYYIVADIDWNKHWLREVRIDECPTDCSVRIKTHDTNGDEYRKYVNQLKAVVNHWIPVPVRKPGVR